MKERIIYCIAWSVGLLVASFYALLQKEDAFVMSGKPIAEVMGEYGMPMIMAMTLYMMDVAYSILTVSSISKMLVVKMLILIVFFLICFVFSILVNCNIGGWILFSLAWLMLTLLKFVTTENINVNTYEIRED